MRLIQEHTPLQKIEDERLSAKGVELYIKRDDLIHPLISGNKWRKLKYNLAQARAENHHTLLTFGGPYSNHIYATAAAAKKFGFRSIGIIRGYEKAVRTPTLQFAESMGMQLIFVTAEAYKEKDAAGLSKILPDWLHTYYIIPEGGTNRYAIPGVSELIQEIDIDYQYICCACGTGGTLAGLVSGIQNDTKVLGFSALKGEDTLSDNVKRLTNSKVEKFTILFDYHFGGYAKVNLSLVEFIKHFKAKHGIQLEPVYTGKMLYGLFDLVAKDFFARGNTIIAIHTGGLQGLCGYLNFFPDLENTFINDSGRAESFL
ncbi:MAG: 1-aminocyclopropane-1-carboxylate deaminase/D-cysteine desulfhydrase [Bacteroidetes bacterium]|nr:1-aminocyclopropane-1-carboxylate deaminase/D-cysteine desulfhydrase [Bacteroidota bacterium]